MFTELEFRFCMDLQPPLLGNSFQGYVWQWLLVSYLLLEKTKFALGCYKTNSEVIQSAALCDGCIGATRSFPNAQLVETGSLPSEVSGTTSFYTSSCFGPKLVLLRLSSWKNIGMDRLSLYLYFQLLSPSTAKKLVNVLQAEVVGKLCSTMVFSFCLLWDKEAEKWIGLKMSFPVVGPSLKMEKRSILCPNETEDKYLVSFLLIWSLISM